MFRRMDKRERASFKSFVLMNTKNSSNMHTMNLVTNTKRRKHWPNKKKNELQQNKTKQKQKNPSLRDRTNEWGESIILRSHT